MKNIILYSLVSLLPFSALAQNAEYEEGYPILSQRQEEMRTYSPEAAAKLSVGGTIGAKYNDNIYRANNDQESDVIAIVAPGFTIRTDMKPYKAQLDGRVEIGHYFSQEDNAYNDADLKGRIAYDIDEANEVYADARARYDHVDVGSFVDDTDLLAAYPTTYRHLEGAIGWNLDDENWIGFVEERSSLYNFDNVDRINGTRFINDDRDYSQHQLTGRSGYKFWPNTALYVQGSVNARNFQKRVDVSLLEPRDSIGYEGIAGVAYGDTTQEWMLDAGAGYLRQDYDFDALEDPDGVAMRAALQWKPIEALRIRGELSRDIREALSQSTSSYIQTRSRIRVDYAADEDWTMGGGIRFTENDFQVTNGSGAPARLDDVVDGSIYADYALAEDYSLGAEYTYIARDSTVEIQQYDANIAMIRLNLNY